MGFLTGPVLPVSALIIVKYQGQFNAKRVLVVPLIWSHNTSMEIKIGDLITDGFEDGVVVDIIVDGGDVWYCVYDGKEAWQMHARDAKKA